MMEYK